MFSEDNSDASTFDVLEGGGAQTPNPRGKRGIGPGQKKRGVNPKKPRSTDGRFLSPESVESQKNSEYSMSTAEILKEGKKESEERINFTASRCLMMIKPWVPDGLSDRVAKFDWDVVRKEDAIGWTRNKTKLGVATVFVALLFIWGAMTAMDSTFDTNLKSKTADIWAPDR